VPAPESVRSEHLPSQPNSSRPVVKAETSHIPVVEKPIKSFSIKDIISEAEEPVEAKAAETTAITEVVTNSSEKEKVALTAEKLGPAWQEFATGLNGEGTRIVSMFKSIVPELQEDNKIVVHLSNAAQKDIFVMNYRQRLQNFLERNFTAPGLDIETVVDHAESNEMIYSDEQKFNYLQAKYPLLKDFKKSFNLDIS